MARHAYRTRAALTLVEGLIIVAVIGVVFFRATEARKVSEIVDDPADTLTFIEVDAAHAVPWMAPRDADEALFLSLGTPNWKTVHGPGTVVAFADGRAMFLPDNTPAEMLRELITVSEKDPRDSAASARDAQAGDVSRESAAAE